MSAAAVDSIRDLRRGSHRALARAFGVFPPRGGPPAKLTPVFEWSDDGVNWTAYRYRYVPTRPDDPPRSIAPFFPRFDHAVFYDGIGLDEANLLSTLISQINPYHHGPVTASQRMMRRLLEGSRVAFAGRTDEPIPRWLPGFARHVAFLAEHLPPTEDERLPVARREGASWAIDVEQPKATPRQRGTAGAA